MTVSITGQPDILTMIHAYHTTPETQQAVFDGLVEGLGLHGHLMAGHLSSSTRKSLDGLRVTSYSQWDAQASRALFENPAALQQSLEWFAPLTSAATGQDAHVYGQVTSWQPAQ